MKKWILLLSVAVLAGCANIAKLDSEQTFNGKMSVKLAQAWNKINLPGAQQPFELMTQDGFTLDQLRIWPGIAPSVALVVEPPKNAQGKAPRVPKFAQGMKLDELASLFEQIHAIDGSAVTLDKTEPALLGGRQGVRLEFSVVRQGDGLQIKGVAWAAEHKGHFYGMSYTAPRLGFFQRYSAQVEEIAKSVAFKN
jgi:hypothetical protein